MMAMAGRHSVRRSAFALVHVFAALAVLTVTAVIAAPAQAALEIDITRGNVKPMPIAITKFNGESARGTQVGGDIADVISKNLERSGLFQPLAERSFIEDPKGITGRPRFGDWRLINAQALVTGRVVEEPDGRVRAEFRLWDVYGEAQIEGVSLVAAPTAWRRIAHKISDAIYKRLTGEDGYFDTRIVYISETGPADKRIKRLALMDQDGQEHRYLTNGNDLVLTPRFSPSRQEITYLAYVNRRPRVYLYNIDTGQQEVLGDFPGMTFAPRFSPDGNQVIMSLADDGNSDVYSMDIRTRRVQRLTNNPAIDTSPSFSPDGTRVTFNSDRSGTQQIYVMNADGGDQKRISFGKGRYATPVWSPRGDLIAFTKSDGGRYHIGVMRPDGSGERLLTESYFEEGPTWAPNGRVLMFYRQAPRGNDGSGGKTQLWSIDLTGYNERVVLTPVDASDPAWSPLSSTGPGR
jgi:TolB protein